MNKVGRWLRFDLWLALIIGLALVVPPAASAYAPAGGVTAPAVEVEVGGMITEDTVWTSDKTYLIVSSLFVGPGVTLTIQAGTQARVASPLDFRVEGTLIVNGEAAHPVRILGPEGGTWGGLFFEDSSVDAQAGAAGNYQSGSLLRHVQITKADLGLVCAGATPYLDHVTTDRGGLTCETGATPLYLLDSWIAGDVLIDQPPAGAAISAAAPDDCAAPGEVLAETALYVKTLNSAYSFPEAVQASAPMADGGAVFAGAWDERAFVFKIDSQGEVVWERLLEYISSDSPSPVTADPNGGATLAVHSPGPVGAGNDVVVIKLDAQGEPVWTRAFNLTRQDKPVAIQVLPDGGYFLLASTYDSTVTRYAVWALRLNAAGGVVWQRTISHYSESIMAHSLVVTDDGFAWLAGGFGSDAWLAKLDLANGEQLWQRSYDTGQSFSAIIPAADGGLLAAGPNLLAGVMYGGDIWWQKTVGAPGELALTSLAPTPDGAYLAAGWLNDGVNEDGLLIKVSEAGELLWQQQVGAENSEKLFSAHLNTDGALQAAGWNADPRLKFWVLKMDQNGQAGGNCPLFRPAYTNLESVYPSMTMSETAKLDPALGNSNPPSVALSADYSLQSTMTCGSNLPKKVWMRRTVIAGEMRLPDNVLVQDVRVGGRAEMGSLSEAVRVQAGDGLRLRGVGSALDSRSGGDLQMDYGRAVGNTVQNGNLIIAAGQALTNTVIGGGIQLGGGSEARGNHVERSPAAALSAGGVVMVTGNRLVGGARGVEMAGGVLQGNLIANSSGVGLTITGDMQVVNNTFTGNRGSAVQIVQATNLVIRGNNFEGNLGAYDLENLVAKTVYPAILAAENWWGALDNAAIAARIWDMTDDAAKSQVVYTPAAAGPVQTAPAYVRAVALDPPSPVGIEPVVFKLTFSRPMDQTVDPQVAFANTSAGQLMAFNSDNSPLSNWSSMVRAAPNGALWVATGNPLSPLYSYAAGQWQAHNLDTGYTGSQVMDITFDSKGVVWVAGEYGLLSYNGDNWTVYRQEISGWPLTVGVKALAACPSGDIWMYRSVSGKYELIRYDGRNWTPRELDFQVADMACDSMSGLWLGTPDRGVANFDGVNWRYYTRANSFAPSDGVTAVGVAPDGRVWATFRWWRPGVAYLQDGLWKIYDINYGAYATDLVVDRQGAAWISLSGSLAADQYQVWEIRPTGEKRLWSIPEQHSVASNALNSMAVGLTGDLWLVTSEEGVLRVAGRRTTVVDGPGQWTAANLWQTGYDMTALTARETYRLVVDGALGVDGMEIAPYEQKTFVVDYDDSQADPTAPPQPILHACAGMTVSEVWAEWKASDPDSAITLYQYAIGTTPGGTDIVGWTTTTEVAFERTNLLLTPGQAFYVALKARNAGGLWSPAAVSEALSAGSGVCVTTERKLYLPSIRR